MIKLCVGLLGLMLIPFMIPIVAVVGAYKYIMNDIAGKYDEDK